MRFGRSLTRGLLLLLSLYTTMAMVFNRKQKDDEPDPWAMADADIAVYDKAFVKQDKDNDGFISIHGESSRKSHP